MLTADHSGFRSSPAGLFGSPVRGGGPALRDMGAGGTTAWAALSDVGWRRRIVSGVDRVGCVMCRQNRVNDNGTRVATE